jgi:cytochrome c-type biogenesis protein
MSALDTLRDLLASGSLIAFPAALAGGVLTGLNPCCLPIYPAAAAACCASRKEDGEAGIGKMPTSSAAALMLGLATATTLLGVVAALGGRTMTQLGGGWAYALAIVPLLAGAHLLGFVKIPLPSVQSGSRVTTITSAFVTGILLSLVFGPCATPLLASLLAYVAYNGRPGYGGLLLFVYGLGIAVPVVLLGATAARLAARLDRNGMRLWVDRAMGGLLVAMGLYVIWTA